ncbi:hypothetical protein AJ79_03446 [Helicocarpus griseus UAMH5409]|uniref:Uncharacterized protein n=1 Tax=Helicocarpus griseus UAMH5409 TaxID=1447875 RepID=A0A2B7XZ50_9EURO|nr:hypothetical protein AJ79_03446 [Helicocarpus griseus UAMH5409]
MQRLLSIFFIFLPILLVAGDPSPAENADIPSILEKAPQAPGTIVDSLLGSDLGQLKLPVPLGDGNVLDLELNPSVLTEPTKQDVSPEPVTSGTPSRRRRTHARDITPLTPRNN